MNVCKWEERALLLKKNGQSRLKGKKIWSMVELERGSNLCAQEYSNKKKESVDFWEKRMSGRELKLFLK